MPSVAGETALASFTLAIGLVDCNRTAVVVFYCLAFVCMGIAQGGAPANALDIAPSYAGVVYGISNLFGNVGGFISPMAIDLLTKNSVSY